MDSRTSPEGEKVKRYTGHILIALSTAVLLVIVQSCTKATCRASVELPGAIVGCVR